MSLILASASATRAEMLRAAGVAFEVVGPGVDEEAIKTRMQADSAEGSTIAMALAEAKALAVSRGYPGRLVLGADQILEFAGIVSKSRNSTEARALLLSLRGATHRLHTAAALARDGGIVSRSYEEARLTMRMFSEAFLDAYLAEGDEAILASVGCYRLEGRGLQLFQAIDGDYFTILGLPLLPLLDQLREQGILPV